MAELPVIDVGALVAGDAPAPERAAVARELDDACRRYGFLYIRNHGVDESLQRRLEELSRELFALPETAKRRVSMAR